MIIISFTYVLLVLMSSFFSYSKTKANALFCSKEMKQKSQQPIFIYLYDIEINIIRK